MILPGIKELDFARLRRDEAPLRAEREQYLTHLLSQGTSPRYTRAVASRLVHINRLLGMSALRLVTTTEVRIATQQWLHYIAEHQSRGVRPSSAYTFQNAAENWLRFHQLLVDSDSRAARPFDPELKEFTQFMEARQTSPDFLRSQSARISVFLTWAGTLFSRISDITLCDLDRFIDEKRCAGLKPRSLVSYCGALRLFFSLCRESRLEPSNDCTGYRKPSGIDVRRQHTFGASLERCPANAE